MKTLSILANTVLGLTVSLNAHAWGVEGHQIVAAIAQSNLQPEAAKEVARLLALEPGATLVSVATWADEHRSPATAAWHYINFPKGDCQYDQERDCPDGKCVVEAIKKQTSILQFDANDEKRLNALKYLVHLVGDVHQPLHAGWGEDRGGNTYQLQAFMRGSNLHAWWDTGMIKYVEEHEGPLLAALQAKKHPPWPKTGNQRQPLWSRVASWIRRVFILGGWSMWSTSTSTARRLNCVCRWRECVWQYC